MPVPPLSAEAVTAFLALEQAGAYVEQQGTLAGNLNRLTAQSRGLLAERRLTDYQETVATTWQVAFRQVRSSSRAAAELLWLCAFLASEEIPVSLLAPGVDRRARALRKAVASDGLDEAVSVLWRFSLVQRVTDGVSVHRLVESVVRADLPIDEQKRRAGAAITALRAAFPAEGDDVAHWPRQTAPPVRLGRRRSRRVPERRTRGDKLGSRSGRHIPLLAGDLTGARACCFERALAITKAAYGADHPTVAAIARNLAGLPEAPS